METKEKTEKQLLDEIDCNRKKILCYHSGVNVKLISGYIASIIEGKDLIHKMQVEKIIEEIKQKYFAAEDAKTEKMLVEITNIILNNWK